MPVSNAEHKEIFLRQRARGVEGLCGSTPGQRESRWIACGFWLVVKPRNGQRASSGQGFARPCAEKPLMAAVAVAVEPMSWKSEDDPTAWQPPGQSTMTFVAWTGVPNDNLAHVLDLGQ